MAATLAQYLEQIDSVKGWLSNTTAAMSHALMAHQTALGVTGNACEIGVHHGRYFIALALGLANGERGLAIDLFDAQDENIDRSGRGNREKFERNAARFLSPETTIVMRANSLRLSAKDILAHGGIRFFSVDGSHTAAATLNDIALAEAALVPGGIVAVDDLFNAAWTGVITGVSSYLNGRPALRPFALVPNKLLLCEPEHARQYAGLLRSTFPAATLRHDAEFMGSAIDVYVELPAPAEAGPAPPPPMTRPRGAKDRRIAHLEDELQALRASRRYRIGSILARLVGKR